MPLLRQGVDVSAAGTRAIVAAAPKKGALGQLKELTGDVAAILRLTR
jgi:hypothetical protein